MQTLYLLDAYALIYRAYYALIRSPRINSKGQNTSAIFGFVNTLHDVLRTHHPDYLGIAFDPAGGTFRHEAYPEYKAQREATPEDIRRDAEGLQTMRTLARNMAWLLKCIRAGREQNILPPEPEKLVRTNFIR